MQPNRLAERARCLADLRTFMAARGVMSVDVPVLGAATVTDPFIDSLKLVGEPARYLQTSPEYYLKRLLAAGSGDVYYLGPAFRHDEASRLHRPEFTLLEWYRTGWDDRRLADELLTLLASLKSSVPTRTVTYHEVFTQALGVCPHTTKTAELRKLAKERTHAKFDSPLKSLWLDLLFSHCVQPQLGDGITIVLDYPACMSALAKLTTNLQGETIARRFECFWDGIELANGYWELTDAEEQRQRFEADRVRRKTLERDDIKPDERFLAALEEGLPECAGVALGVDRLLMALTGAKDIAEVRPFADG